jgi:hypothetical protein
MEKTLQIKTFPLRVEGHGHSLLWVLGETWLQPPGPVKHEGINWKMVVHACGGGMQGVW